MGDWQSGSDLDSIRNSCDVFWKKIDIFAFFIFCLCISVFVFISPTKASRSLLVFFASILMPAVCLKFWTKPRLSFPKPLPRLFFLNKYRHYFPGEHFPKRIPRLFSKEYKLGNFCLSFSTYLTAFHDFWQQVWELSRHDHQPESHQSSFNNTSESLSYKKRQHILVASLCTNMTEMNFALVDNSNRGWD